MFIWQECADQYSNRVCECAGHALVAGPGAWYAMARARAAPVSGEFAVLDLGREDQGARTCHGTACNNHEFRSEHMVHSGCFWYQNALKNKKQKPAVLRPSQSCRHPCPALPCCTLATRYELWPMAADSCPQDAHYLGCRPACKGLGEQLSDWISHHELAWRILYPVSDGVEAPDDRSDIPPGA
jgi:hypothetical protein